MTNATRGKWAQSNRALGVWSSGQHCHKDLKCGEEYTLNKIHALQQQDALYSQQVETGAPGRNMLCELKNTLAKALILIFFSLQCNQLITCSLTRVKRG